jgi:hypothetical protein
LYHPRAVQLHPHVHIGIERQELWQVADEPMDLGHCKADAFAPDRGVAKGSPVRSSREDPSSIDLLSAPLTIPPRDVLAEVGIDQFEAFVTQAVASGARKDLSLG